MLTLDELILEFDALTNENCHVTLTQFENIIKNYGLDL